MTKTCPSCGTVAAPEARFCRRCGTLLRTTGTADDREGLVSPLAATVPLSDEGRTTHGLSADDPARSPDTNRVNRAELDELLRPLKPEPNFQPTPAPGAPGSDDGDNGRQPVEHDDELTISVARLTTRPRQVVPLAVAGSATPFNAEGDTEADAPAASQAAQASAPASPVSSAPHPAQKSRSHRVWYTMAGVSVGLLLITLAAFWFGVGYFRQRAPAPTVADAPPPAVNPQQLSEEKRAEAEALLAGGDLDAAIARLREAVAFDASNIGAQRRLGDLLRDNGRRREAVDVYRAILRHDPRDTEAWRSLARVQLDESLYADASESYRQLIALAGEAGLNDHELLSYAESLRLSGRARDAQGFYQRLAASPVADVANAARQHLSDDASLAPTPSTSPELARAAQEPSNQNRASQTSPPPAMPSPTPAPAAAATSPVSGIAPPAPPVKTENLSSGEHFKRGEQLWPSNRAAALNEFRAAANKGNRDAYYYLGLSIAEGKDPRALHPALLGAAYQYFQNAMRSGRFRSEARRYEQQLGEEVDRRRQQKQ